MNPKLKELLETNPDLEMRVSYYEGQGNYCPIENAEPDQFYWFHVIKVTGIYQQLKWTHVMIPGQLRVVEGKPGLVDSKDEFTAFEDRPSVFVYGVSKLSPYQQGMMHAKILESQGKPKEAFDVWYKTKEEEPEESKQRRREFQARTAEMIGAPRREWLPSYIQSVIEDRN